MNGRVTVTSVQPHDLVERIVRRRKRIKLRLGFLGRGRRGGRLGLDFRGSNGASLDRVSLFGAHSLVRCLATLRGTRSQGAHLDRGVTVTGVERHDLRKHVVACHLGGLCLRAVRGRGRGEQATEHGLFATSVSVWESSEGSSSSAHSGFRCRRGRHCLVQRRQGLEWER